MGFWKRCLAAAAAAAAMVVLAPATAGQADVVTPATAGPIRTISYDVCGANSCQSTLELPAWTTAIKREITDWDADAVMLQELCIGQWIALRDNLPGYRAVWTSTVLEADGCRKWNADARFGLGVLVKTSSPVDRLVGADLNADSFTSSVVGPIRAGVAGTGRFAEVDENDRDHFSAACLAAGARECDTGEGTIAGGRKFDDIFVTSADFHTVRGDAVEPGLSDHRLLRGAAFAEARPAG